MWSSNLFGICRFCSFDWKYCFRNFLFLTVESDVSSIRSLTISTFSFLKKIKTTEKLDSRYHSETFSICFITYSTNTSIHTQKEKKKSMLENRTRVFYEVNKLPSSLRDIVHGTRVSKTAINTHNPSTFLVGNAIFFSIIDYSNNVCREKRSFFLETK